MTDPEIIEYEGRRFVRTGEVRILKTGDIYECISCCIPPIISMAKGDAVGLKGRILRELPAETPASTAGSERDSAVEALRVLNEETVLAGFPGGDRTQTLANVRAMACLLAEAEEALNKIARKVEPILAGNHDKKWAFQTLSEIEGIVGAVLARIRTSKEKQS